MKCSTRFERRIAMLSIVQGKREFKLMAVSDAVSESMHSETCRPTDLTKFVWDLRNIKFALDEIATKIFACLGFRRGALEHLR